MFCSPGAVLSRGKSRYADMQGRLDLSEWSVRANDCCEHVVSILETAHVELRCMTTLEITEQVVR